ncbi:serine hydrolase [Planosporangium sp. 12N6]|uniref:serine hydrolase n=1 Tax=Planosporangium spinosum TaxID=3402278 RepID=UPI003CF01F97
MIRWRSTVVGLAILAAVGIATGQSLRYVPAAGAALWRPVDSVPIPVAGRAPVPPSSTGQRWQQREAALAAALKRYDGGGRVDLAVAVVDRATGRTFSYNGQRPFQTASIVKVEILAALLLENQPTRRPLTEEEKHLAADMIERSDNDAATQLWSHTGGIARCIDAFGLTATALPDDDRWGNTTTTAEDQARLINALASPAGPIEDAGYLFGLMRDVDRSQGWGISAAARPGEAVAVKNGWMPRETTPERWTVNSVGRITGTGTDVTVVVLSHGHDSLESGIDLVEAVAKLTRGTLGW